MGQSFSRYLGGLLIETRDANGNTNATFGYDASGNLASTIDAKNVTRTFGYDANGNQASSSTTVNGTTVTTSTEYDAQGRVVRTVDALGNTSQTFYNALGKVDHTIDKLGNINGFLYDLRGNLIQSTNTDGLFTRTVYNEDARPVLTMDRNGVTGTRTDYDAAGRVTNTVRLTNVVINLVAVGDPGVWSSVATSAGVPYSANSTEYFANGWVKSRTGPDGQKTSYTYYDDGQTRTVIDALTNVTTYAYDEAGRQSYVADALNHTNRFEFDGAGRTVKTILADSSFVTNIFNLLGQRVGTKDQGGLLTQFAYDLSGQLTNVIKPGVIDPADSYHTNSPSWVYRYDAYGRQTETIDPKAHSTTDSYDAYGRPVSRWLPMGGAGTTNFYNSLGQLTNQIDFKGQQRQSRYDRFGRVTTNYFFNTNATHPSNSICYYYNQLGQLTNITERFGTDASSYYVASVDFPSHRRQSWRAAVIASLAKVPQDIFGGLAAMLACGFVLWCVPREQRRQLALCLAEAWREQWSQVADPARIRRWRLVGSMSAEKAPRLPRRFRLPSLGWRFASIITLVCLLGSDPVFDRLWTAQAACAAPLDTGSTMTTRITIFNYDLDGRLAQVNSPEGYINYEYDLATGRHTRTCTANSETACEYDALERLWKVNALKRNGSPINETTTYEYTEVGSRKSVTLPSGVGIKTSYVYDALNRLVGLTNRASDDSILSEFNYQVDATGRRTNAVEIIKTEDAGTVYQTNTLTWQYDGMYRLTNEISSSTVSGASYTTSYQYDQVGNRWQKTRQVGAATETIKSYYNANDQLTREEITPLSGAVNTNYYAYDANGSVIARTNATSSTSTPTLYTYDLKNKMSSVALYNGSWTTNYFQYNEQGIRVRTITGGSTKYFLIDANNHTGYAQVLEELSTVGGTPTKSYVLGDDVLAQATSAASYFLYDGHGSTRQLANASGSVTSRYNYDAYGAKLDTSTTAAQTDFLYCGEQYDSALGMYNLRARYYDPSNGRFNARDTLLGNNEDPQSLHKYAYANCEPVNGMDPSGFGDIAVNLAGILFVTAILLTLATLAIPRGMPGIRPYTGPVIWVRGSESTSTSTSQGERPKPGEDPPPFPWPDPIPGPEGRWGLFVYYSHKPPPTWAFGIFPRAWVTDPSNSGLDDETAYEAFNLFARPKYEYLFRIHLDMLGPPDRQNPGRRIQYEVISPTGAGSLVSWRYVRSKK